MFGNKQIKEPPVPSGDIIFKAMFFHFFTAVTIITQIAVIVISVKGALFPGGDAIVNIAGTCAEIIAGLYGITLAGYTFFLSRMDALMASDMTLNYIVSSVKNRFKVLIWFITINVVVVLFFSVALMYCPAPTGEMPTFWYRLFCNEFIVFLAFSIVLIVYYSVKVIEPNCLEKEAAKLKKKISHSREKGSVTEFISLYDEMERYCNSLIPENVLSQLHENKGKRFENTLELLAEGNSMLRPVIPQIVRIHMYYECTVNCSHMWVSKEMCIQAEKVVRFLEEYTKKYN